MWERACSRMRCDSQRVKRLIHRIREQARSHTARLPFGACCVGQSAFIFKFRSLPWLSPFPAPPSSSAWRVPSGSTAGRPKR
ncbi:hypothetical protein DA482_27375 [Pseudomonas fluorescens]|nr:hypothetical protein D0N73_14890 [Pseudomonas fluorescens]TWR47394.1 hypothetical protein FIP59_10140 [Pseudomonas fluorescens]